jgi:hypothetical protein
VVLGLVASSAAAQTSGKVVKVRAEQESYQVKRGASTNVSVIIDIDAGYHINSNRPLEKFLIATALKLDREPGITTSRVIYPKAKLEKFEFSEKPVSVFEGRAVLRFTARALPGATAGPRALRGKLTVQACNNEQCLRPQTIGVSIGLEVVD